MSSVDCAPAVDFTLGRLDVIARKGFGPVLRAASYTGGNSWQRKLGKVADAPQPPSGAPAPPVDASPAYALSAEGRVAHLCVRAGGFEAGPVWHRRTDDFTRKWTPWRAIGQGTLTSSPALVTSVDGQQVFVVSRGTDKRLWFSYSADAGETWQQHWKAVGAGVFLDVAPTLAATSDLRKIYLFGLGTNGRVWRAVTDDLGKTWPVAFAEIPGLDGIDAAPAAACSADGARILLFVRHDGVIYRSWSTDSGKSWVPWLPIPAGTGLLSAPAATCSWDGSDVHVVAMGADRRLWRARSIDGGKSWPVAWQQVAKEVF